MPYSVEECLAAYLTKVNPDLPPLIQPTGAIAASAGGGYQLFKESIPQTARVLKSTETGGPLGAVAYAVQSDVSEASLAGQTGCWTARILLTLEAGDEKTCGQMVEAIRGRPTKKRLDRFGPGFLGQDPVKVWVQYAYLDERADDFAPSPHAEDRGTFLAHLPLVVCYYQT